MKYLAILIAFLLFSCNSEGDKDANSLEDNFFITGMIKDASNQKVYIQAISKDGTIDVAQGAVQNDGTFDVKGNIPGMGIYQMRLGEDESKIIPLTLMPNDKVTINAELNTFAVNPKFGGTEWAAPLTKYMQMFNEFANNQRGLTEMQKNGATEKDLLNAYNQMRKPLDAFAKAEMLKTPGNPVNIILSSSLSPTTGFDNWDPSNLEILKTVSTAFTKRFEDSPMSETMANQLFQIESAYKEHLNGGDTDISTTSKEMAPEIALKSPEGKIIKLSELRGKYVLIDFWASWCGPCRRENPNVVKMYNQYKNKDFTILSVSLDSDANAWKQAILADGLIWPYHVSDLMKWDTPLLQAYNFNSIPHTVLVDKDGVIIARNLRGASLEQKLKELL